MDMCMHISPAQMLANTALEPTAGDADAPKKPPEPGRG